MVHRRGLVLALAVGLAGQAFAQTPKFDYPKAPRGDVVDDYHGTKVADPYRWLEEYTDQTNAWIEAENKVTFGYLEKIPQRASIKARLTALWNYEKFTAPSIEGGHYFYSRNRGLPNQSVLYVMDKLGADGKALIDPNTWSADGTVAIAGASPSEDGKFLAYGRADAGSDWNTWRIRDIATRS